MTRRAFEAGVACARRPGWVFRRIGDLGSAGTFEWGSGDTASNTRCPNTIKEGWDAPSGGRFCFTRESGRRPSNDFEAKPNCPLRISEATTSWSTSALFPARSRASRVPISSWRPSPSSSRQWMERRCRFGDLRNQEPRPSKPPGCRSRRCRRRTSKPLDAGIACDGIRQGDLSEENARRMRTRRLMA